MMYSIPNVSHQSSDDGTGHMEYIQPYAAYVEGFRVNSKVSDALIVLVAPLPVL